MVDHARCDPSKECCGLLAGRNATITEIFAAANAAPNPATSYELAPRELFAMMRQMRAAHLDFLGIYHSHPSTDNAPSPTDIERAYYPDVAYFILALSAAVSRPVRAFHIRNHAVTEIEIELLTP